MLWRCRRCGTRFAVGLPYCPQCTSTDHEEDGAMPKSTVYGGASNAAELPEREAGPAEALPELPPEAYPPDATPLEEGEGSAAAEETVPDGAVGSVLAWVGDDPERAQRALDHERAKQAPRTTLIAELERRAV
jgi:hypothetical protein